VQSYCSTLRNEVNKPETEDSTKLQEERRKSHLWQTGQGHHSTDDVIDEVGQQTTAEKTARK